ncbi:hypothetical protein ACOI1C_02750 [Bacillus sp. DJP31]|uniref:hypothetical protein n=1 Tax=Bacillus sp. DJP31 TaxID=3409789 RepID=UPI003BB618C3
MEGFFPIILALIFGAISLFSKKNKEDAEGENRKPLIPPRLDPMHPQHFGERKPKREQEEQVVTVPIIEVRNEELVTPYTSIPYQQKREDSITKKMKPITNHSQVQIRNLTKQNLIQGVVMAEILGAPRSKKPHHSSLSKKLPN